VALIEAEHLYKVFGRGAEKGVARLKAGATRDELHAEGLTAAVIDASFTAERGEIFVAMGLSGSGKSTLIRMINGLWEPTAGTMSIDGVDIAGMSPSELRAVRREKISMVFQHFALLPHRTVGENAAYGLQLRGVNRSEREKAGEEALALVGLKGWGDSMPDELSGGMQQRVGLARALAAGTDIMLMDEAFSALDPLIRREMQDQLVELQSDLGKTIVFITHDLNEAMRLGDRIAMLRDGRIEQIGTSEQILNNPANDYVASFIQDVDRTHVLTASSVMERPVAVLGMEQGPRMAHRLMREHQISSLLVVDRQKKLMGGVIEQDVVAAVERGQDDLDGLVLPATTVAPEVPVADLFTVSAESKTALAVVDGERLVGVIPRVTLLSALGAVGGSDDHSADAPHEGIGSTGALKEATS